MTDAPTPGQHKYMVKQAAYITRLRKQLMQEIGPAMQLSLKELRELVLQMDGQGLFRQMQWQQLEDLSSVPLERVSRAVQGVLRASVGEVVEDGAAAAASYISSAPPGAVNMPVDDILDQVMFDRSKYSVGKSLTPEKRDMISRYARKLQDDYNKTVRAGLIADEPTEVIANKVARVRVIRGREEALRRATTFANKVHAQVGNTIDGTIAQTLQIGERRAWKGVVKTQYVWVMDPALENVHCNICWGLSAKEPQDRPSDFWKSPGWHPGCRCRILPVMSVEEGKVSERQRKELAERQRREAERKKAKEEALKREAERKRKLAEQAAKKKAELAAKKKAEAAAKKRAEEAQKKAAAKAAAEKARIEKAKAEQAAKAKAKAAAEKAKAEAKAKAEQAAKAKAVAEAKAKSKPAPVKKAKALATPKFKTTDIDYDYDKNWEKLGYETKAKYRKAKSDVVEWSGNDFEGIRAAQFAQAEKAGADLNPYEKLQTRRLEKGEVRSFGKMGDRLVDFVERAPKYDGTLRRGVALDRPEQVQDLIERYSKGGKNKALESWTSDKKVSDRFAWGNNNPRAHRVSVLVENNTKGAPINAISGFHDEYEVLVPPGVKYEVVEVQETFVKASKTGKAHERMDHTDWVVKLREVPD